MLLFCICFILSFPLYNFSVCIYGCFFFSEQFKICLSALKYLSGYFLKTRTFYYINTIQFKIRNLLLMQLCYLSNRANADFANYPNNVLYSKRKGDSFMIFEYLNILPRISSQENTPKNIWPPWWCWHVCVCQRPTYDFCWPPYAFVCFLF